METSNRSAGQRPGRSNFAHSALMRVGPLGAICAALVNFAAMILLQDPLSRLILGLPAVLLLLAVIIRDFRAQRRHLLRLEVIADRTTNGIVVTDQYGCVVWCNKGFSAISGYSLHELIGKRPGDLLQGPETDHQTVERMRAHIRRGEGFSERVVNYAKGGRPYWITIDCQPFYSELGVLAGFMAVESDVSEQVRLTTELTEAAERAKEAELFAHGVIDALRYPVAILSQSGEIISVNRSWTSLAEQYDRHVSLPPVGTNYLTQCRQGAVHQGGAAIADLIEAVRAGSGEQPVLYDCNHHAARRWFQVSASRFVDEDSTYIVVTHQDVTNLVEAERNLRDSREQLELAINGANLGFWDWHIPTGQTVFGDKWFTMLGYEPGELTADLKTWEKLCHPEDISLAYEAIDRCWKNPGTIYRCQHRLRRKDGGYSWILDLGQVAAWGDDGKPIRMVGVHVDVTQEREAKEELRKQKELLELILEVLPVGVFWTDGEGRYQGVNRAFADDWLGGQRENVRGQRDIDLMSKEYLEGALREAEAEVLRTGSPILNRQSKIVTASGEIRWFEQSRVPIKGSSGRIEGLLGVARDVSVKRRAMEALEQAKMAAIEASKAKSDFLANMSHEIRTPMNGVIGMTELLLDSELRPDQRELGDSILLSARSLLKIINDILDFSKIEARKLTLIKEPFEVSAFISSIQRLYAHRFQARNVVFTVELEGDIPPIVRGDSARLQQVIGNLLANAAKFTPRGSVVLRLEGRNVSAHESEIRFSVRDTGIGIPEDKHKYVFEEFWQLDSSLSRAHGGTGLGLPISRSIVELMGGALDFRSQPGVGSEFYFTVRFQREREKGILPAGEAPPLSQHQPLSILLAEDNPINRRLAVSILSRAGHSVVAVEDGVQAVQAAVAQPFDIILMDIQMPVLDGVGAMQQLRSAANSPNRTTPIVALTAHAMTGDRERYVAAGADEYVTKPIDRQLLLKTIAELYARKKHESQDAP